MLLNLHEFPKEERGTTRPSKGRAQSQADVAVLRIHWNSSNSGLQGSYTPMLDMSFYIVCYREFFFLDLIL